MKDWNVVVTVPEHTYNKSRAFLAQLGDVDRTGFYNVLTMDVPDIEWFLDNLADRMATRPDAAALISHVAPAQRTFKFQDARDFEEQATRTAADWLSELAGCSFHVRIHVIAVDTVHDRAGISLWTRDDLQRFPYLDPE